MAMGDLAQTKLEKAERGFECIDLVSYSLMLLVAIYIIVQHLIIHGRWRNVYLATFYALTCILCVAKITFLTTSF